MRKSFAHPHLWHWHRGVQTVEVCVKPRDLLFDGLVLLGGNTWGRWILSRLASRANNQSITTKAMSHLASFSHYEKISVGIDECLVSKWFNDFKTYSTCSFIVTFSDVIILLSDVFSPWCYLGTSRTRFESDSPSSGRQDPRSSLMVKKVHSSAAREMKDGEKQNLGWACALYISLCN